MNIFWNKMIMVIIILLMIMTILLLTTIMTQRILETILRVFPYFLFHYLQDSIPSFARQDFWLRSVATFGLRVGYVPQMLLVNNFLPYVKLLKKHHFLPSILMALIAVPIVHMIFAEFGDDNCHNWNDKLIEV